MEDVLPRRERERQMRRQEMLQAARAVFAEKGYTHATLDEIAQRAEFGKGTLYNYFEGGKEEILFAIFDELYDDMHTLIESTLHPERMAGQSIRASFHNFFQTIFSFFLEREDDFMLTMKVAQRMVFSENLEQAAYFKQQRERIGSALMGPIKQAMQDGELRPLPVDAVAYAILGNITGIQAHLSLECYSKQKKNTTVDSPQTTADFLTTLLFDGLLSLPDQRPSANN